MSNPTIALAGNPNSGKTSLFNAFTGAHQHVGNWAGVTVEIKEGTAAIGADHFTIIDLPGTYSLSATSPDEQAARDFIISGHPAAIINVCDASNLKRHLSLTLQLIELGVRPVLALNMFDEAQARGIRINIPLLAELLDVPVVTSVARTGIGRDRILAEARDLIKTGTSAYRKTLHYFPAEIDQALGTISTQLNTLKAPTLPPSNWTALKLLEGDAAISAAVIQAGGQAIIDTAAKESDAILRLLGESPETLIAEARYGFIAGMLRECVSTAPAPGHDTSESVDALLTHPIWAYPIFLAAMWVLFQMTFVLGAYPMGWIEWLFEQLSGLAHQYISHPLLRSLIADGIINGVGNVAVFLPNIMILFLGISFMEDTGYMARAAFITDRIMHSVGLHGKSFIPLIMGLGCSVPAIMAARTLESPIDRIKTVLLSPLISCSARLPIYLLFAGAFFPQHAGTMVFLFQFVFGIAAFFGMGLLFHHTLFHGKTYPFVMELPPYRLPTGRGIVIHMWHKSKHYLSKIGGVVLIFSVLIWFLSSFPRPDAATTAAFTAQRQAVAVNPALPEQERWVEQAHIDQAERAAAMEQSLLGTIGKSIEWTVKPLGFDWRGAVALCSGFFAKEIVVSSLSVLYADGNSAHPGETSLASNLRRHYSLLSALAFMFFVLLYTPCLAACFAIKSELRSWGWMLFSIGYQLVLAWVVAFGVYQGGQLLLGGG